jgi:hypothetical protein
MQTNTATKPQILSPKANRILYTAFLMVGIFYLVKKDFSNAIIYWSLALVFDPFNQQVPFNKRAFWQQAWLVAHVLITLAVIVLALL